MAAQLGSTRAGVRTFEMADDIVTRLRERGEWAMHPMGGREWFPDELCEDAADEIEQLRECLQHAIDHVGKWQLFTAEEKQRILAEYEQAVRGG
jgi:hypothetical protein